MLVGKQLAFPICQDIQNEGNALRPSFLPHLLLCVLQFTALSQIANARLDIGQARGWEKEKKCHSQIYFTSICLPKFVSHRFMNHLPLSYYV